MRGATLSKASGSSTPNYFNPRAPCGARRAKRKLLLIPRRYFNPRAPCGARLLGSILAANTQIISIHAPHAGRDGSYSHNHGAQHISIYAPREGRDPRMSAASIRCSKFQSTRPARGATCAPVPCLCPCDISIHAPREGRDQEPARAEPELRHFNPRAPRGARPMQTRTKLPKEPFQSTRPARGATLTVLLVRCVLLIFQSTRPARGATGAVRQQIIKRAISIHAPREGRDMSREVSGRWTEHISIHAPREGRD